MDFLRGLDRGTFYWFVAHPTPRLQPIVLHLNGLGSNAALILLVLVVVVTLLALRRFREAVFVPAAIVLGVVLMRAFQWLIGRQRPDSFTVDWLNAYQAPVGFPGGDALTAALTYMTLAVTIAPLAPRRPVRAVLVGTAALLSALSGLTRLYLGIHFLSDMIAAWIGGLLWALICREVYSRWLAAPLESSRSLAK
jgi:undecaprenyl-diphosphatase